MTLDRTGARDRRIITAGVLFMLAGSGQTARAAEPGPSTASLVVHAERTGAKVSPLLWGTFFEDINCSADGGIYAELVRNRSFEDSGKPEHWAVTGGGDGRVEATVDTSQPLSPKNARSPKVTLGGTGSAVATISNKGFWGIPVKEGEIYRLSVLARCDKEFKGDLMVALSGRDGRCYA
jgi:hypothetical protein